MQVLFLTALGYVLILGTQIVKILTNIYITIFLFAIKETKILVTKSIFRFRVITSLYKTYLAKKKVCTKHNVRRTKLVPQFFFQIHVILICCNNKCIHINNTNQNFHTATSVMACNILFKETYQFFIQIYVKHIINKSN